MILFSNDEYMFLKVLLVECLCSQLLQRCLENEQFHRIVFFLILFNSVTSTGRVMWCFEIPIKQLVTSLIAFPFNVSWNILNICNTFLKAVTCYKRRATIFCKETYSARDLIVVHWRSFCNVAHRLCINGWVSLSLLTMLSSSKWSRGLS